MSINDIFYCLARLTKQKAGKTFPVQFLLLLVGAVISFIDAGIVKTFIEWNPICFIDSPTEMPFGGVFRINRCDLNKPLLNIERSTQSEHDAFAERQTI